MLQLKFPILIWIITKLVFPKGKVIGKNVPIQGQEEAEEGEGVCMSMGLFLFTCSLSAHFQNIIRYCILNQSTEQPAKHNIFILSKEFATTLKVCFPPCIFPFHYSSAKSPTHRKESLKSRWEVLGMGVD